MMRGPVQRISVNGSGRSRVKERMLDYPAPSVPTLLGKGIDTKGLKTRVMYLFEEKLTFKEGISF